MQVGLRADANNALFDLVGAFLEVAVAVVLGVDVARRLDLREAGVGDLVEVIYGTETKQVNEQIDQYRQEYLLDQETLNSQSLKEAARIELGLRSFLKEGGFEALLPDLSL